MARIPNRRPRHARRAREWSGVAPSLPPRCSLLLSSEEERKWEIEGRERGRTSRRWDGVKAAANHRSAVDRRQHRHIRSSHCECPWPNLPSVDERSGDFDSSANLPAHLASGREHRTSRYGQEWIGGWRRTGGRGACLPPLDPSSLFDSRRARKRRKVERTEMS